MAFISISTAAHGRRFYIAGVDSNIPEYPELVAEVQKAKQVMQGIIPDVPVYRTPYANAVSNRLIIKCKPCMTELANIQKWLTSIIIKPGTLTDKIHLADEHYGVNNEAVIRSSIKQTAEQKIGIYARGYVLRLMECMEAEYPALCKLLGEDLFQTFARSYLLKLPSTSPDLYDLGKNFPAFFKSIPTSKCSRSTIQSI